MNFLTTLPDSTSPIKNIRSSDWPPLAVWCVRTRPSRSMSSFLTAMFPLLIIVGGFLSPTPGWAWEVKTHEELTEEAIKINEGDLNAYLINNLGLESGLNESLPGGTPRELIKQGSNNEDDLPRPINHFHNPISNAGLTGPGESAIKWSLKSIGSQNLRGSWSWNDAREYYFKALTSPTKAERDENWGKTFRALGQVMHLLQDSANPSHVRADTHLLLDGLHDYMERRSVASFTAGGIFSPDPSLLENGHAEGNPLANLFDRNTYLGGNPDSTLGTNIGVTEYTNANFFSDDTIPGQNSTDLVYPNLPELVPAPTLPFGPQYLTLPRLGSPTELKARVAKFTGNQSFSKFRLAGLQLDLLNQLQLDDLVYEAYSINLIPRAVGYSAAVLDYFFRGQLETSGTFVVNSGFAGPGPGDCDEVPIDGPFGDLAAGSENPPDSLRAEGTVSYYFDHSSAGSVDTRELLFEGTFAEGEDLPSLSSDDHVLQLANLLHKEPVRWTVVIKGKVGPGVQEGEQAMNAIVAKTTLAEWEFTCDR